MAWNGYRLWEGYQAGGGRVIDRREAWGIWGWSAYSGKSAHGSPAGPPHWRRAESLGAPARGRLSPGRSAGPWATNNVGVLMTGLVPLRPRRMVGWRGRWSWAWTGRTVSGSFGGRCELR